MRNFLPLVFGIHAWILYLHNPIYGIALFDIEIVLCLVKSGRACCFGTLRRSDTIESDRVLIQILYFSALLGTHFLKSKTFFIESESVLHYFIYYFMYYI